MPLASWYGPGFESWYVRHQSGVRTPRSVESEQLIELQVDNCGFSHRIFQVRHIYLLYILNITPWVPAAG